MARGSRPGRSWEHRLAGTAAGLAVGLVGLLVALTTPTFGALNASVNNSANATNAPTLVYSHAYQATTCSNVGVPDTTISCPGTIAPTGAVPATGSVTGTDAITQRSTLAPSAITDQVELNCGPVALTNTPDTANPLLPRYGATPGGGASPVTSASLTLDGTTGYATSVVSQTQPTETVLGSTYGLGIWFKAASGTAGPLFDIGTSPINAAGGNARELYLDTRGQLVFTATSTITATSTASYTDNTWHFAYVTLGGSVLGSTLTLTVDGTTVATGGGLGQSYDADAGYWHVGWAPSPATGVPAYFAGSVADFVVFDTSTAPSAPTAAQRANAAAFNTWAAPATEQWPLADNGSATYAGPYPVLGTTSPCAGLNATWTFANPAATATGTLAGFASSGWAAVATPASGATQTSTLSVSRGTAYNTGFVPGLHLLVPVGFRAFDSTNSLSVTFTWSDPTAPLIE